MSELEYYPNTSLHVDTKRPARDTFRILAGAYNSVSLAMHYVAGTYNLSDVRIRSLARNYLATQKDIFEDEPNHRPNQVASTYYQKIGTQKTPTYAEVTRFIEKHIPDVKRKVSQQESKDNFYISIKDNTKIYPAVENLVIGETKE